MKNFIFAALAALLPSIAQAAISPATTLAGPPIETSECLFAFGEAIAVVNSKGELWVHDVTYTLGSPRHIKGAPISAEARSCFALDDKRVMVLSSSGELFAHDIGKTVGKARRLGGPKVASGGSPAKFIFPRGKKQLAFVNEDGELRVHEIGAAVGAPRHIPGPTIARDGAPASFIVTVGDAVGVVNEGGELWVHDVGKEIGGARRIPGEAITVPKTHSVLTIGKRLVLVSTAGAVTTQDLFDEASPTPPAKLPSGPLPKIFTLVQDGPFSMGVSTIARSGNKVVYDMAGSRPLRSFFDLGANKSWGWNPTEEPLTCYASDAGTWPDPLATTARLAGEQFKDARNKGRGVVNGIDVELKELAKDGAVMRAWFGPYGILIKAQVTKPDGTTSTFYEVKRLSFGKPTTSLKFAMDPRCKGHTVAAGQ